MKDLERKLPPLPLELKNAIIKNGILKEIPSGVVILKDGEYVKYVPLVISGLIKVYGSYNDKELLLYYIEPLESCIMSFSAGLWNLPSKVQAMAEEDSELLLLPVNLVQQWVKKYPSLNNLFFRQYNKRYDDLLLTINQLLFDKLDKRVMTYLKQKAQVLGTNKLDLRHHHIAKEMGTAREVISRVIKKLEMENKILQYDGVIEII